MSEEKSPQSKGGEARASALSPLQRKEIAAKAAAARWGQKPIKATHKGSFQEDFGINVDCYVLDDEQKTAVISQRGMGEILGLGSSGSRLPRFVEGKIISSYVGPELREKLEKPLIFQAQVGGPETLSQVHGYDITILIDLCKAITQAESDRKLMPHQANVARQAHIIINASAKSGIQNLVYRLAGYDATKQEVIAAFKFYVREEAREYEREFPEELYDHWYRLYGLPRPEQNRPWKFKHLTEKQVYEPLARSNGKILSLARESRQQSNRPKGKLHQFLSEIGVKALRVHLGKLTGIASVSDTKEEYERHFNKVFGQQLEMFTE
jgi:hypothetical protein